MMREAGILLPISSLPSKYGIGTFSSEAYAFVDMLVESGQGVWQILPLCPTAFGDSPYQSPCSFAGNPYFICPEALASEGLLTDTECEAYSAGGAEERIDYGSLYEKRYPLLRLAYERFEKNATPEDYSVFLTENSLWLQDYALFMAIKSSLGGAPLSEWSEDIKKRKPQALFHYRQLLSGDIGFWIFLQYKFFQQWGKLKAYANSRGIRIVGDIPIYVSRDSCEVWTNPELFMLNSELEPLFVAGCPPDGFSPTGQLWGNPTYNWTEHKKSSFSWWKSRMEQAFSMYDIVRIDHFRGFHSFYSIPYGAADARNGAWERGVGQELFSQIEQELGKLEVIAEDLGYITDGVRRLVSSCGFMGMKILQFAFDSGDHDSEYFPFNYVEKSVVYTGTHDNPTLYEWLSELSSEKEYMLREYFCDPSSPISELSDKLIAAAMQSGSRLCIIPMQDYLGIGKEGRLNVPASAKGNWSWRLSRGAMDRDITKKIRRLTKIGGRLKK